MTGGDQSWVNRRRPWSSSLRESRPRGGISGHGGWLWYAVFLKHRSGRKSVSKIPEFYTVSTWHFICDSDLHLLCEFCMHRFMHPRIAWHASHRHTYIHGFDPVFYAPYSALHCRIVTAPGTWESVALITTHCLISEIMPACMHKTSCECICMGTQTNLILQFCTL